jgi:hypothetical protein
LFFESLAVRFSRSGDAPVTDCTAGPAGDARRTGTQGDAWGPRTAQWLTAK